MTNHRKLLVILAVIIGLGPLTIDLYLPAFPEMKLFFGTSISQVQLTLSSYLIGFAFFHLVCGPLSDRFGRRPLLLGGLSLYILISILCAFAESIEQLIALRFMQGLSACVAPVIGRAIVRDVFSPDDATKALAMVSAMMALAPVTAPSLGSLLLEIGSWQWTFIFLAFAGAVTWLIVFFSIEESLNTQQAFTLKNISGNMLTLLTDRTYMGSVLTGSFLYAPLFAFLSVAAFIMMDYYEVPRLFFGAYFMFIVLGYILGNFVTARFSDYLGWPVFFKSGMLTTFIASIFLLLSIQYWDHPLAIVLPMLMMAFSVGLVSPKSMSLALQNYPHMAATASALMGFLQMIIASLAGFAAGILFEDHPMPLAFVILSVVIMSATTYFTLLRDQEGATPQHLS